ncbi:hypothetical protein GF336_04080 [Candidatus Woesearchaeota archaeon]|nr:hypothetical protein [Candidatus Woesearchaeota archaeon]
MKRYAPKEIISFKDKIYAKIKDNLLLSKITFFIILTLLEAFFLGVRVDTANRGGFALVYQASPLIRGSLTQDFLFYLPLIFILIGFKKIKNFRSEKDVINLRYIPFHAISYAFIFWFTIFLGKSTTFAQENLILASLLWHLAGFIYVSSAVLLLFSIQDIKKLAKKLYKEILISLALASSYVFLFINYFEHVRSEGTIMHTISYYFALLAVHSAKLGAFFLSKIFTSMTMTVEYLGFTLRYKTQAVNHSLGCSGKVMFYSFIFFWLLYGVVNYKELNRIRYALGFFMGFLLHFLLDSMRVFLFFLVWIFFPGLGIQLFHSNARIIWFAVTFFIILSLFKRWMKKKPSKKNK